MAKGARGRGPGRGKKGGLLENPPFVEPTLADLGIDKHLAAEALGVGKGTIDRDAIGPNGPVSPEVISGDASCPSRASIRERTKAGLAAAAARGRQGGRKPVVTSDKLTRARGLLANGLTVREAAMRVKVGKTALYRALSEATPASTRVS
jgi:hypothetical protein